MYSGVKTFTGPTSYTQGGFTETIGEVSKITSVVISARNLSGNQRIKYSVSGNVVTIQIFTITADTTTGDINETEVGNGVDLSSLVFDLYYEGI